MVLDVASLAPYIPFCQNVLEGASSATVNRGLYGKFEEEEVAG
jgi:hypothetical protein